MPITPLNRTVLTISGPTCHEFLDPLITNSITTNTDDNTIVFAALLTPQGKIIADFFIHKSVESETPNTPTLYLETSTKFAKALLLRLKMYKLRSPVELADRSDDFSVYAVWDGIGDLGRPDPRHAQLGHRLITAKDAIESEQEPSLYDAHRLSLGIPDSEHDFETTSTFPADVNMDLLHGIDYKKGCFIGQEVVSRMHRKAETRKRMCRLSADQTITAETGAPILAGSVKLGVLAHADAQNGIGIIRIDRLGKIEDAPRLEGLEIKITPPPIS